MGEPVRYDRVEGGVAVVTIDRPEVRNAMNMDVFDGLYAAGRRAGADEEVRAVVVTGEGNFSSGIDTTIFTSGPTPGQVDIPALQRSFTVFEQIAKPAVAAVRGPAFGAGLQLAIACDLRVVAPDARLAVMEVRWGIVPDLGGTQRLPRLIGLSRARDLAYTGREIDGREAFAWGLADRLAEGDAVLDEAIALARELAAGPPLALGAIKRLTSASFGQDIATGLEQEASAQRAILRSADFIEAVTARVQRRAPRFQAR